MAFRVGMGLGRSVSSLSWGANAHATRVASLSASKTIFKTQKRAKSAGGPITTPSHPGYELNEAIKLSKCLSWASFDETLELSCGTCVDPKKPNQMIRGLASLPHGTGKAVRVAVFAKDKKAEEAREAGADIVGAQELVDLINDGNIDFTRCIATPDMMPMVGKVARILGPKGLMPNPKVGTVTMDIGNAVKAAKQGEIQFKCDKYGTVRVPVGKLSFTSEALVQNITTFVSELNAAKPSGARGTLIQAVHISSTMGRGVKLHLGHAPFKKGKEATGAGAQAINANAQGIIA